MVLAEANKNKEWNKFATISNIGKKSGTNSRKEPK